MTTEMLLILIAGAKTQSNANFHPNPCRGCSRSWQSATCDREKTNENDGGPAEECASDWATLDVYAAIWTHFLE